MKQIKIFFTLLSLIVLASCAGRVDLEKAKNISTVYIDLSQTNLIINYAGPGQAWSNATGGVIGGAIGGAVSAAAGGGGYVDEQTRILNYLIENEIDIISEIKESLEVKIPQNFNYEIVEDKISANTFLVIEDITFALSSSNPFNKNVLPTLNYEVMLIDSNNEQILKQRTYFHTTSGGNNLEEWLINEAQFNAMIESAVETSTDYFINTVKNRLQ